MLLSVLVKNPLNDSATEPIPFGEATTPARYRGRAKFDADACSGCRTCEYVCASGAIHFEERPDGLHFTLWHNTCVFCGMCQQNCLSMAIRLSNDWHLAHPQNMKYAMVEQGTVVYKPCLQCGKQMLPTPAPLMQLAYHGNSKQIETLRQLCINCRRSISAGGKR